MHLWSPHYRMDVSILEGAEEIHEDVEGTERFCYEEESVLLGKEDV